MSRVPPVLRTPRLEFRPYTEDDEVNFVRLFQQEEVARWMGDGLDSEESDRAMFGRIFTKVYAQGLFDVWAVRDESGFVGHAEIKPAPGIPGAHEIVYAVDRPHWGRKLGVEIVTALVGHGFGALGLDTVHATVDEDNVPSLRVLTGLGFRHERDITEDDGSVTRVLVLQRNSPHGG